MKFCIVGTGRCGTTLLWRMLNEHPDIFVYRETHWLPALHEEFGTAQGPTEAMLDIVLRTRHVTGQATTSFDVSAFRAHSSWRDEMTISEFADALGGFLAQIEGKKVWADKTPDYGYFAATLQVHWPECRIIHLIRDGVDCAQSMSRHIGYRALIGLQRRHWPPVSLDFEAPEKEFQNQPLRSCADLWATRLIRARDEATRLHPNSYMELRYERLVEEPEIVLEQIGAFADLPYDSSWLNKATSMVDQGRAKRRRRPQPEEVANLSAMALDLLDQLGYRDQSS